MKGTSAMHLHNRLKLPLLLPALLLAFGAASCSTSPPVSEGGTASPTGVSAGPQARGADFETPRKPDGEVFVMVITNGISPFWDPMAIGMRKAAADIGCRAEWTGPQNSTVAEQKRLVEDALSKNVDGIALSCIEAEASIPLIELALSRGVPVITFDSDSPASRRLAYIGTNNTNAGRAAGEKAAELLPAGGEFVAFVGNISAQNARERQEGFEQAAGTQQVTVKQVLDDNKDASRARRNVEDSISRHGDKIQGLLGLFSYNGPAIAQAVTSSGLRDRYKIVCFDAEPVTLQELAKGNIDATVVQKPYDFGYLSTQMLYLINRKGFSEAMREMDVPEDGIVDTGVEVITPANVGEYRRKLEALGVKSS
jgi:ribose transport system substrate-binding protein